MASDSLRTFAPPPTRGGWRPRSTPSRPNSTRCIRAPNAALSRRRWPARSAAFGARGQGGAALMQAILRILNEEIRHRLRAGETGAGWRISPRRWTRALPDLRRRRWPSPFGAGGAGSDGRGAGHKRRAGARAHVRSSGSMTWLSEALKPPRRRDPNRGRVEALRAAHGLEHDAVSRLDSASGGFCGVRKALASLGPYHLSRELALYRTLVRSTWRPPNC